jgi:hypothetical protein
MGQENASVDLTTECCQIHGGLCKVQTRFYSQYLSEKALALVPEGGRCPRDRGSERILG